MKNGKPRTARRTRPGQGLVSRIPLGFMGDGRDTAYAALFLASDEARFITGTEIIVERNGRALRLSERRSMSMTKAEVAPSAASAPFLSSSKS